MALFSMFCFKCKAGDPKIQIKKNGTAVSIEQEYLHCRNSFQWDSQPLILGKYPAGNILLSYAILVSGASISKILLVFRHMGLSMYSIRTYFRHQSSLLFPSIISYWKTYQKRLLDSWRKTDNTWSGDGRFDSMGHSAKYCAYTLMNCTEMKIGHFELLQVSIL
jgi:solute carrier family 8 (sodium/calcium exchanger)